MTIPNHINTASDAYRYARDVIKGRWKEGELTIMFSDYVSDYAKLRGMNCDYIKQQ